MSVSTEGFCKKHLTNLAEWKKLGEANIFPAKSRLELINGEIIEIAPIGSHHASHHKRLINIFSTLIQGSAIIAARDPLELGGLSEPESEPDFMLLRPSSDFYYKKPPYCKRCVLVNRNR